MEVITPRSNNNDQAEVRSVEAVSAKAVALRQIERIEALKTQIKTVQEMLTDELDRDTDYSLRLSEKLQATEFTKQAKARAMQSPLLTQYKVQIKELKDELKEHKSGLGVQLGLFYQQTGMPYVEAPDQTKYWISMGYKKGKKSD